MTAGLILALIAGVVGLLTSWLLKRREEGKLGGAAERRLRADLQRSLDTLSAGGDKPTTAWLNPGLRITTWSEHFDRLVPRFLPAAWDRIEGAVAALDGLQAWAEVNADDDGKPPENADARTIATARAAVEAVVNELDRRHDTWLAWRPWLNEKWPLHGRVARWAGRIALAVAIVVLGIVVYQQVLYDPTTSSRVEAELREMEPDARLVNCSGDDAKDRWMCTVVTDVCRTAAAKPTPCGGEAQNESRLQADADKKTENVHFKLVALAADRALAQPPPGVGTRLKAWVRRLGHPEPPVSLAPSPGG